MQILKGFTFFFMMPILAFSSSINVPADYPTIQQGINAAVNGDTVLVAPGVYVENIDFNGKAITVKSSAGPLVTTIDGSSPLDPEYGSVVTFQSAEGQDSVLDGFTLTRGTGTLVIDYYYYGGGIFCYISSPTIQNNIIENNTVIPSNHGGSGGGIYCYAAPKPLILNNVIQGNRVKNGCGGIGFHDSLARIEGNLISENEADDNGGIGAGAGTSEIIGNYIINNTSKDNGGGISCWWCKNTKIIGNIIMGNSAWDRGGGIYSRDCSLTLRNNIIAGNSLQETDGEGGGIFGLVVTLEMENNTIAYNSAKGEGGGLWLYNNCYANISNSIFWGNSAPSGGEIHMGPSYIIDISYSDVEPGKSVGNINWGSGNIGMDPFFVDAANNDYHLQATSNCRDAGSPLYSGPLTSDFEGDPRIAYGTVDMGADEFYTHLYVTGDKTPSGSIQGKFVGLPGTSPVGLFIGSGILPTPANTMWGEFWLQAPWFLFTLVPIPSNGILELPTTLPGSIPAPYDISMQALIGLNSDSLTNLCVLEVR